MNSDTNVISRCALLKLSARLQNVKNEAWDGQIAKKLSVLKPQRLRNFYFFHFQYHNFENTVTNFDKDMFRKESFCGTNSYS